MSKYPFCSAIIVAAGSGKRMQLAIPKQFINLDDKPILAHTIANLITPALIHELILVLPEDYLHHPILQKCLEGIKVPYKIVPGGKERQDSVFNALQHLNPESKLVLIHDGVRPFVKEEQVEELVHACLDADGAILAIPIYETVKEVEDGNVKKTLDRSHLYLAQTPQVFHKEILIKAYQNAILQKFTGTDDAMLVEQIGGKVVIVKGSRRNIKITCQSDLELAKFLLENDSVEC